MIQSHSQETLRRRLQIDDGGNAYQAAAGTTDFEGEWLDTAGYDSVELSLAVGAIAAGGSVTAKVEYSDDGVTADGDIEGSSQALTDTDDNKIMIWDIHQIDPTMRYLRLNITRGNGGNSALDGSDAILYNGRKMPVSAHSTVVREVYASPIGGTA